MKEDILVISYIFKLQKMMDAYRVACECTSQCSKILFLIFHLLDNFNSNRINQVSTKPNPTRNLISLN